MKYKHFLAIALGLISATNVYSQWIEHDKTQKNGRIIITSASEVYEESGKEGKIALYYRQIADNSVYIIALDSQERLHVEVGYKLLMKHLDNTITELTCIDNGDSHHEVGSFGFKFWSSELYSTTDCILYEITLLSTKSCGRLL